MNRPRRFAAGQTFRVDGLDYRIRAGHKLRRTDAAPGYDLVLEVRTTRGWTPVSMVAGFLAADFYFENESALSPPSAGYDGGQRYCDYVVEAIDQGWRHARDHLERDRRGSRQPRNRRRPAGAEVQS